MTYETAIMWSYMNVLTKKRYDALLQVFGDLDTALQEVNLEMLRELGCREETAMAALNRMDELDIDHYQAVLQKLGIEFITIEGELYPEPLRNLPDPPVFLYYKGDVALLDQPSIALVGTRNMSPYGKRVTELFTSTITNAGLVTVSGLAMGIDAVVAEETLACTGKTIAVLGHGLGAIYPKSNTKLAQKIVDSGGLLLSEFPLDQPPDKYTFPARNRIIAGVSKATVVLEAGEGSGALITADLAQDYGRDVYIVPGQIFDENYAGSHKALAKNKGALAAHPDDILADLGIVASTNTGTSFAPESDMEATLYAILTPMPQSVTELTERAKLDAGTVNATLTMMELRSAAKNVGNGMWVRS